MVDLYCNEKLVQKDFKLGDNVHLTGLKAGQEQILELRDGTKVIHSKTFQTKG